VLILVYMVAEVIGGIITNSLALLADAGHMLSDAAALALALFATWIARRPATSPHTYGYYRSEILVALVNGATLVAVSIYIFAEAYGRIGEPPEVQGALMFGIATGGLLINLVCLVILNSGKTESLNVHGAWLHVLTDALGSVGAITAGALIWLFNWYWADPIASLLIGVLVLYSAWNLLKEAVMVLMECAPGHIDVDEVHNTLHEVVGVRSVHDLHIWTITSGLVALSAHITAEPNQPQQILLRQIGQVLHDRFGIDHTTIQVEPEGYEECEMPV
jgi:cobalt-zinc-cadmium efflux system protein